MWNIPTQQRLAQIPKLYETENVSVKDKIVCLHFFIGGCEWYVCEFDGEDTFWGFVILNDTLNAEWGYFSFSELKSVRLSGYYEVDCELEEYWEVRPASQVDKICLAQGWNQQMIPSNRLDTASI